MIICQQCHAQTDDGAIFCDECGHELSPPPGRAGNTPLPATSPSAVRPPPAPFGVVRDTPAQASPVPPPVIVLKLPSGDQFTLRGKSEYTIGRLGADQTRPDVDLARFYGFEAGVSRQHIMIHCRMDGVFVEDLESRNETVHNGYRLLPQQWYPLRDGDELRLGAIILHVSFERP